MAIGTARADGLAGRPILHEARSKTASRLLPFLFLLFVVNFLDRTSIAYASLGMSRDLGFSERVFGFGVGVFFIGYLSLQIQGALLAERWSARKTIAASMIAWGATTALTGLVHTPVELYFARFLLGLAEASFFPGVVVYLGHWFIREDRAKAVGGYMAAVPLSQMIGSPIAGWIISHQWLRIAGWRWLFFLEGLPAILLGVVAIFYLCDRPTDAAWLTADQRQRITRTLENEKPVRDRAVSLFDTLRSGRVMSLAAVAFLAYFASYTAIYWMPTLMKRQTGLPDVRIGLLLAIPFGVALLGMLFNGWHSDRMLERRWHAAVPVWSLALGALGLAILPLSVSTLLALFSLITLEMAYLPVFWAIPAEILSPSAAASAVGVMSTIANIAGFAGPVLFAALNTRTGSSQAGYTMLLVSAAASGALMLLIPGMRSKVAHNRG